MLGGARQAAGAFERSPCLHVVGRRTTNRHQFQLREHAGERCAQLVRGVFEEAALGDFGFAQRPEQAIELIDEAADFRRHPSVVSGSRSLDPRVAIWRSTLRSGSVAKPTPSQMTSSAVASCAASTASDERSTLARASSRLCRVSATLMMNPRCALAAR